MECRWEECIEIYQQRMECTNYLAHDLDQITVRQVLQAYGHLHRWMDAIEFFAEYVTEKMKPEAIQIRRIIANSKRFASVTLARQKKVLLNNPNNTEPLDNNIDLVLKCVISILVEHNQVIKQGSSTRCTYVFNFITITIRDVSRLVKFQMFSIPFLSEG